MSKNSKGQQRASIVGSPFIEVTKNDDGHWNWMLWSETGARLAVGPKWLPKRSDIMAQIQRAKESMPNARAVMLPAPNEPEKPTEE